VDYTYISIEDEGKTKTYSLKKVSEENKITLSKGTKTYNEG
jgi:hypothetical protein